MVERLLLAACLALAGEALAAEELRTLFHTAKERVELDRQRRGEPPEAARAAPRAPPVVSGFVKRSDGRNTVWLDGQAVTGPEANHLADPAKVREGARDERRGIEFRPSR